MLEFLRILDEYRLKCENEGNYLEAARATQQLNTLRKQEERRQTKALKARQLAERQDVQLAHNMQYAEFNVAWDKYIQEYDQMAQMYIQQMQEKHAIKLREFQEKLHDDLTKRPPKFSRELLDWRQRQLMLAKQRKYAEAEKIKRIADEMERRERQKLDDGRLQMFQQKEAKFRQQQQSELAALLKRIDARRKEHIKQRALDSKRYGSRCRACMRAPVRVAHCAYAMPAFCNETEMCRLCWSPSKLWKPTGGSRTSRTRLQVLTVEPRNVWGVCNEEAMNRKHCTQMPFHVLYPERPSA